MTLRKFIILTVVFFSLVSCLRGQGSDNRQDKGKSRVEYFYYGGYSDTIYALIHGRVYERETTATGRDTLMPLSNVAVQIEQNSKSTTTNGSGEFDIGLAKGVYSLMV